MFPQGGSGNMRGGEGGRSNLGWGRDSSSDLWRDTIAVWDPGCEAYMTLFLTRWWAWGHRPLLCTNVTGAVDRSAFIGQCPDCFLYYSLVSYTEHPTVFFLMSSSADAWHFLALHLWGHLRHWWEARWKRVSYLVLGVYFCLLEYSFGTAI